MAYSPEIREAAKRLYLRHHTPDEIRAELALPNNRVIYYWADKYNWRGDAIEAECFAFLAARTLANLPISYPKTTGVWKPMIGGVIAYPA